MIVTIFLLAFVLMVAGIAGLISAINLVPTDLGFTYFQAGSTALSAGIVVLAIGLAVRVLERSLQRRAMPLMANTPAPEPVVDLPSLPIHADEPKATSGFAAGGAIALGAAGAAAAAVAASSLAGASHGAVAEPIPAAPADIPPDTLHDRLTAELERDLFAETIGDLRTELALSPVPEVAPVSAADLAMPDPEAPVSDTPVTLPDLFVFPALEPIPQAEPAPETKPDEKEPDNQPEAEPDDAASAGDMPSGPAQPDELAADIAAASVGLDMPEVAAPDVAPPVPPTPAPGLIHDADYAAVADEMLPPLAPLSGLEIVGAYDSGGTRFTMYSDGSVTAAGPEGEKRFRSLEELRRHIDSGQA